MTTVLTGLENFISSPPENLKNKRLGLLCNPASVNRRFIHAKDLIHRAFPGRIKAIFSPQHGFFAEKQDNMIESDHLTDPELGIPVFSLYGETRIPTKQMFDHIDTLIIDIQDVGTRVYTFIYTISYCLEAAAAYGKKVIILDRPNPVGGEAVEGNVLKSGLASFVGRFPIPMRHGMTAGEISQYFNRTFDINCDLEVIPMSGWKRGMTFPDTGLPWVTPSPNLPTPRSSMVYPGQVIFEGTNVSEGRGTTLPFELFGAPYIDPAKILADVKPEEFPGIILRPAYFEPTSNKWRSELCRGFQIHITDVNSYAPYVTSLKLLQLIIKHHGESFEWKQPPYEYEFEKLPADLIIGDTDIRKRIERLDNIDEIASSWKNETERFISESKKFHLYLNVT